MVQKDQSDTGLNGRFLQPLLNMMGNRVDATPSCGYLEY